MQRSQRQAKIGQLMKKIIFAFLLTFFASSANAEDVVNFYEVKDVPITQQSDDLTTMRDKAIAEGQHKAMDIFQSRLKARGLIADPITMTDSQINEAIDSIEVRDEKIFTHSYRAKLNITFSPRVITKYFNIDYIKPIPVPDKYLVIPMLNDSDGTKIWRHKWWDVMQKVKNKNVILPLGDLEDVRSFTREDYSVRDFRNLLKLEKKYSSSAILLAIVEYVPTEQKIIMNIERIKGTDVETYSYDIKSKGAADEAQLMAIAANNLTKRININNFDSNADIDTTDDTTPKAIPSNMDVKAKPGKPKGEALTPIPAEDDVYQKDTPRTEGTTNSEAKNDETANAGTDHEVDAPVSTEPQLTDIYVYSQDLISWGRIRQKITNTDMVTNIRIKSFTAGKAYITITHKGDFAGVVNALEANGLEVSRGTKYWEIREKKS